MHFCTAQLQVEKVQVQVVCSYVRRHGETQ